MKDFTLIIENPILKSGKKSSEAKREVRLNEKKAWDAAHAYRKKHAIDGFVEPDIDSTIYGFENQKNLKLKSETVDYLDSWPKPPKIKDSFVWHLLSDYSQLRDAREKVRQKLLPEKRIKIAHIDTGYQPGHPALPHFLNEGISFIKDENRGPAIDKTRKSFQEQDGHGTATMAILAGRKVFYNQNGISFNGEFGAIPFAEIIPIRICDTVALIRSQNLVDAIYYAIEKDCEVISMSMAGAPTKQWAKAINWAYDAGVTVVSAAGNSWNSGAKKILPKRTLYPARWARVISATGATSNHLPYVFKAQLTTKSEGGETMQGNYGPKKVMETSIAGYTPNTVWATINESSNNPLFRFDGGGTSSATPQIAAAAALWLTYYKEEIEANLKKFGEPWRKVEAVKFALFQAADKSYEFYQKYYGNGILKAKEALEVFPNWEKLNPAKKARTSLDGILDLLGILIRLKDSTHKNDLNQLFEDEMLTTEILQLLHMNPRLHPFLEMDETQLWTEEQKNKISSIILESENASNTLKDRIKSIQ